MANRPLLLAVLSSLSLVTACATFHSGAMPGEPRDASYAQVAGARVRFVDVGPKQAGKANSTVVLLHGFASSLETWQGLIPKLAQDHRVIALDLKGFGWTDRPEGDYSPGAQAQLVRELLRQRGVERASVVAHSWGGSVALALAASEPLLVQRVVLYDAWVYDEQLPPFFRWAMVPGVGEALFGLYYKQQPEARLSLGFYQPERVPQQLVDDVERALDRPGTTAAALAAVRGEGFEALEQRYRTIQQPVLILWGREDAVSAPHIAERLVRDLPHARLQWFARCGHFPMLEAAAASDLAVIAFLQPELLPEGTP
jgi:pimeloyl-ACP methyl ester carboxylesterase